MLHSTDFLRKWRSVIPSDRYNEFVEDLRSLLIWRLDTFRTDQKHGGFTDETGDLFIHACKVDLQNKKKKEKESK